MLFELDQIAVNAAVYNGQTHEIAIEAKDLISNLKTEIFKKIITPEAIEKQIRRKT